MLSMNMQPLSIGWLLKLKMPPPRSEFPTHLAERDDETKACFVLFGKSLPTRGLHSLSATALFFPRKYNHVAYAGCAAIHCTRLGRSASSAVRPGENVRDGADRKVIVSSCGATAA